MGEMKTCMYWIGYVSVEAAYLVPSLHRSIQSIADQEHMYEPS